MLHYIITNRTIFSDAKGEYIREDGGDTAGEELRFGTFDSSIYDEKKKNCRESVTLFPDLPAPKKSPDVPLASTAPVYTKAQLDQPTEDLIGSQRFFTELFKQMSAIEGDLLFFVHGYHTDLSGALSSICELEAKYITKDSPIKHIVAFTWPAMDKYLRYRSDAKDAESSGFTLARSYLMLIDFFKALFGTDKSNPTPVEPCNNKIHMVAHSMGNRVVENMMIELLRQKGANVTALFTEVVLAASDIDWQVFEEPRALYYLTSICHRVNVYYNKNDAALWISETTKNAFNRLGKFGFHDPNKIPGHCYSVDCTGVKDVTGLENKLVQHWYYKESPTVVKDIIEVFKGRNVEDFVPSLRTSIPGNAVQYRLNK